MNEFEASGVFWAPPFPEKRLWGKLRFAPGDGISLLLDGNLGEREIPDDKFEVPVLNGILFNGANCTILNGFCHIETFITGEYHYRSDIFAREMIGGVSFSQPEECKLAELHLRFSHLNNWFNSPYRIKHKRGGLRESLLIYDPDSFETTVDIQGQPAKITSFCSRTIPTSVTPEGLKWSYDYGLLIKPTEPQLLDWYIELSASLRRLFILLIGSGVYTLDCTAQIPSPSEESQQVALYLPVGIPSVVRIDPYYFSTRHEDIRSVLPDVIRTWFTREAELSVATNAYAEALLTDGISPQSLFLLIVQTLEHFHGILWTDESRYVPKLVWRRLVGWFSDSFPGELEGVSSPDMERLLAIKSIVAGRMGGLNQLSFRSRIEQLFKSVPGIELMPLINNPRDSDTYLKDFLPRIEATRHYLTHFSDEQREMSFTREELEEAVLQCWAVLTFWLAQYLGFGEKVAGDMALQAREAMFLVNQGAKI